MVGSGNGGRWSSVDEVVEAYESAQARDGRADLREFAPPADHPERLAILCELVRVDMEYGWRRGRPDPLESYREQFPELFRDARLAREVAYEESRLRRQAGEVFPPFPDRAPSAIRSQDPTYALVNAPGDGGADGVAAAATAYRAYQDEAAPDPAGLESMFVSRQVPREPADLFSSLHRSNPRAADRLARAVEDMPASGTEFLGFRLQSELGRGAFGRVYLARQGDLADRLVALKVSADVAGETRALAQLQHTNIVPIYSVHRAGVLQAVCMPYLGSTTLADVLTELRKHKTLPDSGAGLLSSHRRRNQGARPPSKGSGDRPSESPAAGALLAPASATTAGPTVQAERLCGLGYVQAVLWLVARLAEGLGHAHEHGILHLDLKPANVLFSDDGEPLLLDFNLAADLKHPARASAVMLGGTLPYMAPEHLDAFRDGSRSVDARSDLFALGVILYELLTKRHPYEVRRGAVDDVVPRMIADRQGPPPGAWRWNRRVSPAVESIVRRCLEPEPDRRYQSARELREDLQRQLDDLPLKHAPEPSFRERLGKWARRHPRLTSTTTVGVLAACLLAAVTVGLLIRQHDFTRLEAADSFRRLTAEVPQAEALLAWRDADPGQLDDGFSLCRQALGRYRVLDDPAWTARSRVESLPVADRDRLRREVGDLLLLYARAVGWRSESAPDPALRAERVRLAGRLTDLAEPCFPEEEIPRALWLQRADLARLAGRDDEARSLSERAESVPMRTPRDRFWFVVNELGRGRNGNLMAAVRETTRQEPRNFTNWLLLGNCHVRLGQLDEAAFCYGTGIALNPELYWPYFNRGLAYLDLKKYPQALADFDQVIALRPNPAEAYINRALARMGMEDFAGAVVDLGLALERSGAPVRALFIRARARERLGESRGARLDREEGLRRRPEDELSWVVRGLARLPGDPEGALADFDAALALNPRSLHALRNVASVLAERPGRTEEAVRALDRALTMHPDSVEALAGRGVLLARLGRRDAALQDARAALDRDDAAGTLYQAAGVYALTSKQEPGDFREALRLMAAALRKDPAWLKVVPHDRELDPIRDKPEFRQLLGALAVVVHNETPEQKSLARRDAKK